MPKPRAYYIRRSIEKREDLPCRKRFYAFAQAFVAELAQTDDIELAALRAGKRQGWLAGGYSPLKDATIKKKALTLLKRPDVCAAVAQIFDVSAGFAPHHGAKKLVDWIEGNVVGPDGESLPASLDALKFYFGMVIPKPERKSITRNLNVNATLPAPRMDELPKMAPRAIGAVVVNEERESSTE